MDLRQTYYALRDLASRHEEALADARESFPPDDADAETVLAHHEQMITHLLQAQTEQLSLLATLLEGLVDQDDDEDDDSD